MAKTTYNYDGFDYDTIDEVFCAIYEDIAEELILEKITESHSCAEILKAIKDGNFEMYIDAVEELTQRIFDEQVTMND